MKRMFFGIAVLVAFCMMSFSVFAGVGNDMPSGPHYNLNIIGAKSDKDVGDSDGHTLFVPLNGKCKILMSQSQDGTFQVTDRNGTDGKASFNIGDSNPTDALTHYLVFARALGKPGGKVVITPGVTFVDTVVGDVYFLLGEVTIARSNGKPKTQDITGLFYVTVTILVTDVDGDGIYDPIDGDVIATYTNEWVFGIDELLEYWWDYTNTGLKLLQVRFYEGELPAAAPANGNPTTTWGSIKNR